MTRRRVNRTARKGIKKEKKIKIQNLGETDEIAPKKGFFILEFLTLIINWTQ